MATHTTNYNLTKPEASDPFADFRADYNDNLDIIDANLGGGGSSSLAGLSDVNLTTPTDGQVLTYDGNSSKWVNANGGGGGGDSVSWTQIQASGTKIAEIDINGTSQDVYAPSGGGSSVNYSTSEQVIGTWIDGKPLYQKTIDCGYCPNASQLNVAHNISDVKKFVFVEAGGWSDLGSYYPIPYVQRSNVSYQIQMNVTASVVQIITASNLFTNVYVYATLKYTKTTD